MKSKIRMDHHNPLWWAVFGMGIVVEGAPRGLESVDIVNGLLEDFTFEFVFDEAIEGVEFTSPLVCEDFSVSSLAFVQGDVEETDEWESIVNRVSMEGIQFSCSANTRASLAFFTSTGSVTVGSGDTNIAVEFETMSKDFSKVIPTAGGATTQSCEDMLTLDLDVELDMSGIGAILGVFVDVFVPTVEAAVQEALCPTLQSLSAQVGELISSNVLVDLVGDIPEESPVLDPVGVEQALRDVLSPPSRLTHFGDIINDELMTRLESELRLSPLVTNVISEGLDLLTESYSAEGLASGLEGVINTLFGSNIDIHSNDLVGLVQNSCYRELRQLLIDLVSGNPSDTLQATLISCSGLDELNENLDEVLTDLYEEFEFLEALIDEFFSLLETETTSTDTDIPNENSTAGDAAGDLGSDIEDIVTEFLSDYLNSTIQEVLELAEVPANVVDFLDGVIDLSVGIQELTDLLQGENTNITQVLEALGLDLPDTVPGLDWNMTSSAFDFDIEAILNSSLTDLASLLNDTFPEVQPYVDFILDNSATTRDLLTEYVSINLDLGDLGSVGLSLWDLKLRASVTSEENPVALVGQGTTLLPILNLESLFIDVAFNMTITMGSSITEIVHVSLDLGLILDTAITSAFNFDAIREFGFQKLEHIQDLFGVMLDLAACGAGSISIAAPAQATETSFALAVFDENDELSGFFLDTIRSLTTLYSPAVPTLMQQAIPLVLAGITSGETSQNWFSLESATKSMCKRNPVFTESNAGSDDSEPGEADDTDAGDSGNSIGDSAGVIAAVVGTVAVFGFAGVLVIFGIIPAGFLMGKNKGRSLTAIETKAIDDEVSAKVDAKVEVSI